MTVRAGAADDAPVRDEVAGASQRLGLGRAFTASGLAGFCLMAAELTAVPVAGAVVR